MLLCICIIFSTVFSINVIEMNTLIKGETVSWALPPGSWDTETTTDYTRSQQFPRQEQSFHKNATVEEGWMGKGAGPKKNSSSVLWSPDYSGAKGLQKRRPMKKNKDHGIWSHPFMANRWENNGNSDRLYFLVLQNHCGQ